VEIEIVMEDNSPDYLRSECHFSSGICETLTCCLDGEFDNLGYPINICPHFPCPQYKEFVFLIEKKRYEDDF
jgi:hypothetical protein